MDNETIQMLKKLLNVICFGIVDSINEKEGTVRVIFPDRDNSTSQYLPLLSNEYNMPKIGEQVLCLFLTNDTENGVAIGPFYSDVKKTPVQNKNIYMKKIDDDLTLQYNKSSKKLTINATNEIVINGNIKVNGYITSTI